MIADLLSVLFYGWWTVLVTRAAFRADRRYASDRLQRETAYLLQVRRGR